MLARMKQATSSRQITNEQAEAASKDLDEFKGFFPSGKVSKGKYMLVTRRGSDGALLLEYEVSEDYSPDGWLCHKRRAEMGW